jgi:hypothetical protein
MVGEITERMLHYRFYAGVDSSYRFSIWSAGKIVVSSRTSPRLAGTLLRKGPAVDRLLGSLIVDASAIRRDLGWSPPLTMQQGLAETVKWYEGKYGR